jgi:hypothetical protein
MISSSISLTSRDGRVVLIQREERRSTMPIWVANAGA